MMNLRANSTVSILPSSMRLKTSNTTTMKWCVYVCKKEIIKKNIYKYILIEDLKYNHNEMVCVCGWVGVCVQKLPFVVRLETSSTRTTMKWCGRVGWWVGWYNRNTMLRMCEWVGVLVPSQ